MGLDPICLMLLRVGETGTCRGTPGAPRAERRGPWFSEKSHPQEGCLSQFPIFTLRHVQAH